MSLRKILNFPIEKGIKMYSMIRSQDDQGISRTQAIRTAFSLDGDLINYFLDKRNERDFRAFIETAQNIYGFDAKAFYEGAKKVWKGKDRSEEFLGKALYEMVNEMYKEQMNVDPKVFDIRFRTA